MAEPLPLGTKEPLQPISVEYRQSGADEPERELPTYHRTEMLGRSALGRPRHLRVDRLGRMMLSPEGAVGEALVNLAAQMEELTKLVHKLVYAAGEMVEEDLDDWD